MKGTRNTVLKKKMSGKDIHIKKYAVKTYALHRVINDWNKLSSEVINCWTVQQFERAYDRLKHVDRLSYT